jgi:hypothetical protein
VLFLGCEVIPPVASTQELKVERIKSDLEALLCRYDKYPPDELQEGTPGIHNINRRVW